MSESENTPATSPDPALPGEGDSDQLPKQDTLETRGVDDLLEEGYSPPDRDPLRGQNLTQAEVIEGDTIEERLDAEEPEVWEPGAEPQPEREPDRAGRLENEDDVDGPGGRREQDMTAEDVGVAGGAATAEEAAMRVRDEDDAIGITDEGSSVG
ncbi:DUF5709 domain-containing protein [Georgenia sunbinii]|uniref:DUF5709 domain-containing protein n=1 Tax=Georgenia sunbinii TaxID=3117728 RepID=UPI002F25EFE5